MIHLLGLLLLVFSLNAQAQCYQIHGDRMDYATIVNEDLDLGEEYRLSKAQKITNPQALQLLRGLLPLLKFSESKSLNKIIRKDIQVKSTKGLTVHPIRFLLYGQRKAYIIKERISATHYYSLIIYLDEECPLQ